MRYLLFILVAVSLSACQVIDGPSMMPTGYNPHTQLYKSQPGPEPRHHEHDAHHYCGCADKCTHEENCGCNKYSACDAMNDDEKVCMVYNQGEPMCGSSYKQESLNLEPPKRDYNE